MTIYQSIIGLVYSERFFKNVQNALPNEVEEIQMTSFGMSWVGTGTYKYNLEISVNGEYLTLSKKTHDSMTYDWFKDSEINRNYSNWVKRNVISMLEDEHNHEVILEAINQKDDE